MKTEDEERPTIHLNADELDQVCRLCLQTADFMISMYDRIDPNPEKRPLCERVHDLYQIKVSKIVYNLFRFDLETDLLIVWKCSCNF